MFLLPVTKGKISTQLQKYRCLFKYWGGVGEFDFDRNWVSVQEEEIVQKHKSPE